jgi:monofunctional glycosyltransferase
MMRALKWSGAVIGSVLLAGAMYLGVRIMMERSKAPAKVASIITQMDPAIDRLTPERLNMLLAVEDPTFFNNDGIDLDTPGAGMTTLSQGLGKQIFFERFRPGPRKIELMILTKFALVPTVSRRDILRATLASAYLGNDADGPIIGFAEAARRYHHKPLDTLSDREWLSLVALLPAPNDLDPVRHPAENAERVDRIQRLLASSCKPAGLRDVMLDGCAL